MTAWPLPDTANLTTFSDNKGGAWASKISLNESYVEERQKYPEVETFRMLRHSRKRGAASATDRKAQLSVVFGYQ